MVNNVYSIYIYVDSIYILIVSKQYYSIFFLINTIYIDCLICIKTTVFLYDDDATQTDRGRIFLFNKFDKFLLLFLPTYFFQLLARSSRSSNMMLQILV